MKKNNYISPHVQAVRVALPTAIMTSVNINGNVDGEARAKEFWGHSFPWEDDDNLYDDEDDM